MNYRRATLALGLLTLALSVEAHGLPQVTTIPPQAQKTSHGFYRTSFNCEAAITDSEHLVCTNPDLAAKDVALAQTFSNARDRVTNFAVLRAHARESLKWRDQYCHDAKCVSDWYSTQQQWYTSVING